MALENSDILAIKKTIMDALKSFGGSKGGGSSISDSIDDIDDDLKEYSKTVKAQVASSKTVNKALGSLLTAYQEAAKSLTEAALAGENSAAAQEQQALALQEYSKTIIKSNAYYLSMNKVVDKLAIGSMAEQVVILEGLSRNQRKYSNDVASAQRTQALVGAALIQSHQGIKKGTLEYSKYVDSLQGVMAESNVLRHLSTGYKQSIDAVDEAGNNSVENINPQRAAEIRASLSTADSIITNSIAALEKLGLTMSSMSSHPAGPAGAIEEAIGNTGQADLIKDTLKNTVVQLSKAGFDLGLGFEVIGKDGQVLDSALEKLAGTLPNDVIKNLVALGSESKLAGQALDKVGASARATVAGSLERFATLSPSEMLTKGLLALGDMALFKRAIGDLARSLTQVGKQAMDFNIAQVPASFAQVQYEAVKLGMSFEDTVKFMQDNKLPLGLLGPKAADQMLGALNGTLSKFGYNAAQAASLIGPSFEEAMKTGINIQDPQEMNSFVLKTQQAFSKIAGIVNISAAEYVKMNSALADNTTVSEHMIGLSRQQASAYFDSLKAQRDELTVRLGSIQAAQHLLELQASAQGEGPEQILEDSFKLLVQGQMAGFSAQDSARAGDIVRQGANASKEDQDYLRDFLAKTGQSRQQAVTAQGTSGFGVQVQRLYNQNTDLSGQYKSLQDNLAVQTVQAQRANKGSSADQLAASAKAALGSQDVGVLGGLYNSAVAFKDSAFVGVVFSSVTALGSLTASALLASRAMAGISGKGIFESIKTIFGNLLGGKGGGGGSNPVSEMAQRMGGGALAAEEGAAGVTAATAAGNASKASVLSRLGKAAGGLKGGLGIGLAGAALGLGAEYVAQGAEDNGNFAGAGGIRVAKDAISGAALGAFLGPIGAALGGAIGGAIGLYTNWDDISGKNSGPAVPALGQPTSITEPVAFNPNPTVNTAGDTDRSATDIDLAANGANPLSVSDPEAKAHLDKIADQSEQQTKILQQMLENQQRGGQVSQPLSSQMYRPGGTSNGYISGMA